MSERLFWGRSRRHMVPPLTPLTTYAPLPPALVTAQQTFPVFVQILEEKKGWLPAATTNHISTLASRALLAIPLLALLRFQPDTSFYSHIELCLKHQWGKKAFKLTSVFVSSSLSDKGQFCEGNTTKTFPRVRFDQTPVFSLLHICRLTSCKPCICIFCSKR